VQDVKKFLDAFLDSENPGVIAIKGDWGAGKTYFVTHYLQERPAISNKLVSFV
jgi:tRNA A37 threonylcarbamoyladenosine biosynthesis protein TsaE